MGLPRLLLDKREVMWPLSWPWKGLSSWVAIGCYTTLRIVRLKKKEKHLKKHTTLNLEYHSPKEEDIKQLLWDSTK
ncbi:hypothetical protein Tco_1429468 [Tanacetum coccineum]